MYKMAHMSMHKISDQKTMKYSWAVYYPISAMKTQNPRLINLRITVGKNQE